MYNRITEILEELVFNKKITRYTVYRNEDTYEINISSLIPIKLALTILNKICQLGYSEAITSIEYNNSNEFTIVFDISEIDRIDESEGKIDKFSFLDIDLSDKEK